MAEIRFSPEAITDLQQTKAYITEELCNKQAAVGMVAKITKRIRRGTYFRHIPIPFIPLIKNCYYHKDKF